MMIQSMQSQLHLQDKTEALFDRSLFAGKVLAFWAKITHRSRQLLSLDEIESTNITVKHLDRQPVPLNAIVGTSGRTDRFDCDFHPMHTRDRQRWVGVASGMLRDISQIPPVDLIRVGDAYYVIDGHHRVSVAHAMDWLFIDANVIEWQPTE